jgi:hypothetical protein
MAQSDPIWQRAKAELTISDRAGVRDLFLWEHTVRVVRVARMLLEVPEIAVQDVDRTALQAAALFHGVGWALQCRDGLASRWEVLTRPTTEAQRDLSASWLSKNGSEYVSDRSLVVACTAIRLANSRDAGTAESRVLTDAENLDSVGPLAFWQMVRRHSAEGKGVQAAVEAWNRQKEYNFWEARIKDGFRSQAARQLAYKRLDALQAFVEALCTHHRADDVAEKIGRPAGEFEPSLDRVL